jgi:hypothetical protein
VVIVFWNSAIVHNAHVRMQGGEPTIGDGIKAAARRLPTIIVWGILSGTVAMLLRALRNARRSNNFALRILVMSMSWAFQFTWYVMSFFFLPVMMIEGKGVKDGISTSSDLFHRTWGENITSSLGLGLIAFLFFLPILGITILGVIFLTDYALAFILFFIIAVLILVLVFVTAGTVTRTACYELATTGEVPDGFPTLQQDLWQPAPPPPAYV